MSAPQLVNHLADHFALASLGTVTQDIFEDEIPRNKEGLLLVDAGGRPGDRIFGSTIVRIQVTARYANPATARTKIWAVWALVGNLQKGRIGGPSGTMILDAQAAQQPFPLGKDEDGKFRHVVNIEFTLGLHS